MLYIAMRFVEGTDLRSLLDEQGPVEPSRAATIVDRVGRALDAAHAQGLVHRDVKPANILLADAAGRDHVYLTDFGLSRHVHATSGPTRTGAFMGTIDYVAPEQARGERVDARADVYSLGCVLFTALTGGVPFDLDNDLAKLYAHDRSPAPSVLARNPDLPEAFETVLARALREASGRALPVRGRPRPRRRWPRPRDRRFPGPSASSPPARRRRRIRRRPRRRPSSAIRRRRRARRPPPRSPPCSSRRRGATSAAAQETELESPTIERDDAHAPAARDGAGREAQAPRSARRGRGRGRRRGRRGDRARRRR